MVSLSILFFFLMFIYLFFRERKSMCMNRGRAEGGTRRNPSRLCTVSTEPDAGLELTTCEIMIWAEIKGQKINWLSHPGALVSLSILSAFYVRVLTTIDNHCLYPLFHWRLQKGNILTLSFLFYFFSWNFLAEIFSIEKIFLLPMIYSKV